MYLNYSLKKYKGKGFLSHEPSKSPIVCLQTLLPSSVVRVLRRVSLRVKCMYFRDTRRLCSFVSCPESLGRFSVFTLIYKGQITFNAS